MTATTEVRPAHRFDEAALRDYLRERLGDVGRESFAVRQYAVGQSNPTFLIETDGLKLVLRKKPPGPLLPSAHQIEREYRIQDALRGSGVPVPEMLLLCRDESIIGTGFYVMRHVEGRITQDPALPGLAPAERRAIYESMGDTLVALHRVDWQALGLADYGKPSGYIARQIALWSRQYEASKRAPIPDMDRLMERLTALIPPHDETTIAHGDYRMGNLIIHPTEPRIIAVLDWELATLGHPLSDLAYNCIGYYRASGIALQPGLLGLDLAALGVPSEADYVARYAERRGIGPIECWPFYVAFALFRLASIAQGVYDRGLKGNASAPNAAAYGATVPELASAACGLIDRLD